MTDLAELRSARPTRSPAARALRLQCIFTRLQEGASYGEIAAEEGLSRERLRQIIRAATVRGGSAPNHKRRQFARLEPALRLVARNVAEGERLFRFSSSSSTGSTAIAIRACSKTELGF